MKKKWMIILLISFCLLAGQTVSAKEYDAKVIKKLTVYCKAGTQTGALVLADGTVVRLEPEDLVRVIGSKKASDGKTFKQVEFVYQNQSLMQGYVNEDYIEKTEISSGKTDKKFERYLKKQGFPKSYRNLLQQLHAKYPNWIFLADKIEADFQKSVTVQAKAGKNLVIPSMLSFRSLQSGCYNALENQFYWYRDSYSASESVIAYYMDPRNFLYENGIFQFYRLTYDKKYEKLDTIKKIFAGTPYENKKVDGKSFARKVLEIAKAENISAYYLAGRVVNAYPDGQSDSILNYLASNLKKEAEQGTSYYQKFDVSGIKYIKQSSTNLYAAVKAAIGIAICFSEEQRQEESLVFHIPVYEGMEESVPLAADNQSSNNYLASLTVSEQELLPAFTSAVRSYHVVVENSVTKIKVTGEALDKNAKVTGTGEYELLEGYNLITVSVCAQNGSIASYMIHVIRKTPIVYRDRVTKKISLQSDYRLNKNQHYISKVAPGTTVEEVLEHLTLENGTAKLVSRKNKAVTKGIIKTGMKYVIYQKKGKKKKKAATYTFIVYGDVNGDGNINMSDILAVNRHITKKKELKDCYLEAANANRGNDGITQEDIMQICSEFLGIRKITQ